MIEKGIHIEDVIDQMGLIAFSQQCYQQMSDLSGTDFTAGQISDLEQAACDLIDSLPQAYQDSFAVLDYGFYLHNRSMDQGVEDIWPEVIQAADAISPYYLLLGRVPGREGEVKVEVKFFDNCFTEYDIHSLSRAINSEFNSRDVDITEKLTFAITEFASRAEKKLNCCVSQQKKSSSAIDTSYLELALFIDNACCPVLAYERPVGVVSSFATMPQIEYILEYNTSLNSCVDLNAEILVYFARETDVIERNRKDTLRFNYYLLDLNTKYSIDFQDQFQGGRIDFILTDGNNDTLEVFHWTIKGKNPSAGRVYGYIDDKNYADTFWFLKQIATHENGAHPKRLGDPLHQFNPYNANSEALREDWDQSSRCPNLSDNKDGGWGLTQLTLMPGNQPNPSSVALWNWKTNIDAAYDLLNHSDKVGSVDRRLNEWLPLVEDWNRLHQMPLDTVEYHSEFVDGNITWVHAINDYFSGDANIEAHFPDELSEGERSFLDAMIIKTYNGLGAGTNDHHYYYLTQETTVDPLTNREIPKKPKWNVDNTAHYGGGVNYYVRSISNTNIPR